MEEGGDGHECGTDKNRGKRSVVEKFEDYNSESDHDCDDDNRIRKRIDKKM